LGVKSQIADADLSRSSVDSESVPAAANSGGSRARLTGIDIARLIAVAGMVMVHFGPNPVPDTTAGQIYEVSHGRASILFALLAGLGVALLFRNRRDDQYMLGRGELLLRAALLLPVGLWLQDLDHGVLVILQFYALYFVFATLIVGLSNGTLLVIGLGALAFGPVAYEFLNQAYPEWFSAAAPTIGDPVTKIVRDLFVSGHYPLVTWAAPLALGVWLGRQNLWSNQIRGLMVVVGSALVAITSGIEQLADSLGDVGKSAFLDGDPHTQTHIWMTDAIGLALVVLGISLFVGQLGGRLVRPLVVAGQMALSIYVGHLLILHLNSDLLRREDVAGAFLSVGVFLLVTIALCSLWKVAFVRGPLEAALRAPWQLIERDSERGRRGPG
jgi:uncharacterized membrane protein YeiB